MQMKSFLLILIILLSIETSPAAGITVAWDASASPEVVGYLAYKGRAAGSMTARSMSEARCLIALKISLLGLGSSQLPHTMQQEMRATMPQHRMTLRSSMSLLSSKARPFSRS
jgi:hypothetical protein